MVVPVVWTMEELGHHLRGLGALNGKQAIDGFDVQESLERLPQFPPAVTIG